MNLFSLRSGGYLSGTDGPDWFVGDDDVAVVGEGKRGMTERGEGEKEGSSDGKIEKVEGRDAQEPIRFSFLYLRGQ